MRDKRPSSNLTMYFVESFQKGGNIGAKLELDWLTRDRSIIILGITSKSRKATSEMNGNEIRQTVKDRLSSLDKRECKLKTHLNQLSYLGSSNEEAKLRREQILKEIENIQTEKYIVKSAGRFLLNHHRIDQLTNDMSWKPGISKGTVKESKWATAIQPKSKSMFLLNRLKFAETQLKAERVQTENTTENKDT